MFKAGDKIRLKDGTLHVMKTDGLPPRAGRRRRATTGELPVIRGFIRGALVDCLTGKEDIGDWNENVITAYGHSQIIRNFVGMAGSSVAQWWGLGSTTNTAAGNSSNLSSMSVLGSEYGTGATGAGTATRANVSISQAIAGTWTLSQSWQYASNQVAADAVLNCLAQFGNVSVGTPSAYSMATFTQSTKGTGQALNITYNWSFGT